ncbi:MAG: hypothetical protein M1817_004889 [Caeruleum heppii]|nr:MAG: hypothetical protein M1817_004889 [Caeruleum heppii]
MASWGRSFWAGGGRASPFAASAYPPQVTNDDYSYITADDLAAPPASYDPSRAPRGPGNAPLVDDDVIILKIRGTSYPIHFRPYIIDDGELRVADLKVKAAEILGLSDLRRIRLLYKGKNLKDELRPCRDEGLKIDSEVLCVVSDDLDDRRAPLSPVDRTDDDELSESDGDTSGAHGGESPPKRRQHRGKKKKKGKKSSVPSSETGMPHLAPPGGSGTGRSRSTSPAPSSAPTTPKEKLDELSSLFHTKFLPQSVQFTNHPPSDPAKRDFEYKKLTETILSQILLKLDAVETEGDPELRQRRKDLVKETQGVLTGLDAVVKSGSA